MTSHDSVTIRQKSTVQSTPGLFRGILVLGLLMIIFWAIIRVMPRYIACVFSGEFDGYFYCQHDVRYTTQQGMGSSVQEREYLLRP